VWAGRREPGAASLPDVPQAIELLAAFDPLSARQGAPSAEHTRRYALLDVFTENPLEGNQLAVFTDARGLAAEDMQRLARELRLSETVFALAPAGAADIAIRIFTPATELPFAGHPVLGTGMLLAGAVARDEVTLETGMGRVAVRLRRENARVVSGWMRQPIPSWAPYEHAEQLLRALGVERSELPVAVYENGPTHVLVGLASAAAVSELRPDMRALAALGEVCTSCFSGAGRHWRTRMFAPALGVEEDPATGSAAGPLAVHLSRHECIAFGQEIEIAQGDEIGRPSLLYAFADGSPARVERVEVGGSGVVVGAGAFVLG
jgi:trans-2,3-dihydro-3-hydroxyanthranilate isomerase